MADSQVLYVSPQKVAFPSALLYFLGIRADLKHSYPPSSLSYNRLKASCFHPSHMRVESDENAYQLTTAVFFKEGHKKLATAGYDLAHRSIKTSLGFAYCKIYVTLKIHRHNRPEKEASSKLWEQILRRQLQRDLPCKSGITKFYWVTRHDYLVAHLN